MKITKTSGFSATKLEYTVSEAVYESIENFNDYYGSKTDNAVRELEELKVKFGRLCEILSENHVLNRYEIEKLLGYDFDVEND